MTPVSVTFSIEKLIRPHLRDAVGYSTARDEFLGNSQTAYTYLDANENPFPSDFNRYPDPHHRQLKQVISQLRRLPDSFIFLGNGSDEGIDLLLRAVCEPGADSVLVCPPTYGMYSVSARLHNLSVVQVPLRKDFQLDVAGIKASISDRTRLLFLCSPNNPTGNLLRTEDIEELLQTFPGLVVLDEAYVDFARSGSSWLSRIPDYPNLVVLQTFSKAWGLAGLRLGAAYGHPELIKVLNLLKAPYNLNAATQRLAHYCLSDPGQRALFIEQVAILRAERDRLANMLPHLEGVALVHPSEANFLLVAFENASSVFQQLLERGIVVRDRSTQPGCEGCLRITVGTPEENERLLKVLAQITAQV